MYKIVYVLDVTFVVHDTWNVCIVIACTIYSVTHVYSFDATFEVYDTWNTCVSNWCDVCSAIHVYLIDVIFIWMFAYILIMQGIAPALLFYAAINKQKNIIVTIYI